MKIKSIRLQYLTYHRKLRAFQNAERELKAARTGLLDTLTLGRKTPVGVNEYVTKRCIYVSEHLVEAYEFLKICVTHAL